MSSHPIHVSKAVLAGVLGTIAMTLFALYVPPLMGMPPMNPAGLIAKNAGGSMLVGWIGHFAIGIILALIYAFVYRFLPGPSALRGALYSIAPWLFAQVVVMPLMGLPFFMGVPQLAIGSLIGHLVYGVVVGLAYGKP